MTLRVLLWLTALFSGVIVWLPLVRGATQGDAYRWALAGGIGGSGVGGSYWMLPAAAALVFYLLYLGWRGARPPFHVLLLAFHLPLAAAVTYAARTDPSGFRFEGATLGVSVPLTVIGPLVFCGTAALAILWVVRDLRSGRPRERVPWVWTKPTRVRAAILVLLVPLEVILFHAGGVQSVPNLIGVGAVGWQWILINRILAGSREVG